MKHIKLFEDIKSKDLQETIDEILDNLKSKGSLSKSEREFMIEASNDTITNVTTPNNTGNFWADISNPHNSGILWIGKDNVWKELESLEKERDEELSKTESDDDSWHRRKKEGILRYADKMPELKSTLNDLALELLEVSKMKKKYLSKLKNLSKDYNYNQKVDYAVDDIDSLFNQFGPLIDKVILDDELGEYRIV